MESAAPCGPGPRTNVWDCACGYFARSAKSRRHKRDAFSPVYAVELDSQCEGSLSRACFSLCSYPAMSGCWSFVVIHPGFPTAAPRDFALITSTSNLRRAPVAMTASASCLLAITSRYGFRSQRRR